jgi:hypothetical protein
MTGVFPDVRHDVAVRLSRLVAEGGTVEVHRRLRAGTDGEVEYATCRIATDTRELTTEGTDPTFAAIAALEAWERPNAASDAVDEASEESFPGSDAPAF